MTDLAAGLGSFLSETWGRPVVVEGVRASSTGARRANVAFDAVEDGVRRELVATILPSASIQLNPIDAEAGVRTLALQAGVPVPAVVGVSTDPRWVGSPFFVSERVDGETVPRAVLRLIEAHGIGEKVAGQLGEALARLHAVDPARAPDGLLELPAGPPAPSALAVLTTALDGLLAARPALTYGQRWLERHLPAAPATTCIVHTDVRTGNLIVGPEGLRAVLDWEGSCRGGDPMEDLAWLALRMWRFRNDRLEVGGFAPRRALVDAYEAAGGRFDAERFRWWKVYGTLKWALGLAAQAAAHLDGSVPSIVMAASGRRVVEMEWDLLMLVRPSGSGMPR